jgi:uncharacterized YccA/Bax inhibitor family protein
MSKQMLNEKTFADTQAYQPITIPGRPDEVARPKVMTLNGTIGRAAFLLLITIVCATFGWQQADQLSDVVNTIMLIGLLGLIGLSLLTAFKPQIAPLTGPVYAVVMGFWCGVISFGYEQVYDGIVLQAVFATLAVFAACLFLYGSRIVKVTNKFVAVVGVATLGILLMYVAAIVLGLFGVELTFINSPSPLGILLSVAICIVAALNLFVDFHFIEQGASRGAPSFMSWYCAFGLMATLIWLYLEMLRLLGKIRG